MPWGESLSEVKSRGRSLSAWLKSPQRVSLAFHELRGKGFLARAAEIKLDDFKFLFRVPRFTPQGGGRVPGGGGAARTLGGVFSTSRPDGVSISRVSQILGVSSLSVIRFSLFSQKFLQKNAYKIHDSPLLQMLGNLYA